MKILALETSGAQCEVALLCDGQLLLRGESGASHSRILLAMVEELLASGDLPLSALDAIAVCSGPGSFTGLRIGVAVAQGLAFATNLPVLPVSSLAALALQANDALQPADTKIKNSGPGFDILATLDARKQQIYYGWFRCQQGEIHQLGELQLAAPENISRPQLPGAAFAGASANQDSADVAANGTPDVAASLLELQSYSVGCGLDYAQAMPAWVQQLPRVTDCNAQPGAAAIASLGEKLWRKGGQLVATDLRPVYLREKVTD